MMEASFPIFMILALAVGGGLLAVFVVWVGKQIANEQTRSQGLAAAGIALGVVVLGFLVMGTWTVVDRTATLAPPSPVRESSTAIERNGSLKIQVQSGHLALAPPTAVAPRSVTVTGGAQAVGQAKLAWGPLTMVVIVVGVIAVIVSSKRGLAAALACLGIVAAVLVMYLFAARSAHDVALVGEVAPYVQSSTAWPTVSDVDHGLEVIEARNDSAPEETRGEADAASDQKVEAEAAKDEKKAAVSSSPDDAKPSTKNSPPAWVHSEPTMEDGVYRAVVVSGPYSTKRECETQLDEPLREAMMEYANDHLPPQVRFHAWGNTSYVRNYLIEERYLEEEHYGVGKMYNLHVRLKVGPEQVARFNALAHEWQVRQAVGETSIGGLFVLGSLVVAYGALRYMGCKKRGAACDSGIPNPDATSSNP